MNGETLQTLLIITAAEIGFVLLSLCIFLIWRKVKAKKEDLKAVKDLVENVKEIEPNRRESLLKVFGECYDMEENELNTAVDEFLNRERAFYKTMISVYVDRDAKEFSKLSGALVEMVKPYSDLALSAELSTDSEELEALQEQNKELSKELDESKKVMDELLTEYSATFDKEGEGTTAESIQKSKTDESNEDTDQTKEEQKSEDIEFEESSQDEQSNDLVSEPDTSKELESEEDISIEASDEIEIESDLIVEEDISNEIEVELNEDDQTDLPAEISIEEELEEDQSDEVSLDDIDLELETEA
ncbi:MAG: hypothetical protein AB8D52_01075 [Gammaproteobacteria bacterium]